MKGFGAVIVAAVLFGVFWLWGQGIRPAQPGRPAVVRITPSHPAHPSAPVRHVLPTHRATKTKAGGKH